MSFGNCLLFASLFLSISELPPPSESQSLKEYEQQVVRIRGFWYPVTSEQGILAAHPDLKSCCLSSPNKMGQQILVKGEVGAFSSQKAITIEGLFKMAPLYNEEGKLMQFYVVEEAKEVPFFPFSSLILGGGGGIMLFYWIKRRSLYSKYGK